MINLKKVFILTLFLVLLISISGCTGKKDVKKAVEEVRTGTEGIVLSFLPNSPPEKVHVESPPVENTFDVILDIRNKGAYPQPEQITGSGGPAGKVYLSGFDTNIIELKLKEPKSGATESGGDLSKLALDGKSTINPYGGQDILGFQGTIKYENLNVEKYEPIFLATACYHYETVAGPSVCIDPDPYTTLNVKKVCEVQGIALSSQGAPIAIVKIDEEAFATKTQFKITIRNVGSGDVLKDEALPKCNPHGTTIKSDTSPSQKIEREDIDKAKVDFVKMSNDKLLNCGPFVDRIDGTVKSTSGGLIRLTNGEGFIICDLEKNDYGKTTSAYTTPLVIQLSYGYRNTVQRKLEVKKEKK